MTSLPFEERENITDSYETEESFDFIGGGAFAQVYAGTALRDGEHVRGGHKVALKVISKKNLTTEKKKDIINEVEILRMLSNSHCARLVEAFQTSFQVVIVMDLVEGKELLQVLSDNAFTESMIHGVMTQLLDALQYLHSTVRVVHRDVKPENIMLTPQPDGSFHVTLVDFGLARVIGDQQRQRLAGLAAHQRMLNGGPRLGRNASVESLDQQDSPFLATPCGTVGYLAPETLRGLNQSAFYTTKALLPRSDVYSAGIILYLMLCGNVPFHGHENRQALYKQMEKGPSFDGPRWEHISAEAKEAAALMLRADPANRPSLDEVAHLPWFNGNTALNEQSCTQVDALLRQRDYEVSVFDAIKPPEYMMNEEQENEHAGGSSAAGRCVTVPFGTRPAGNSYF